MNQKNLWKTLRTTLKGVAALVALCLGLLGAVIAYELFIEPLPNKAERRFIASIETRLQKPGDWALVSDIHPGDWTKVCLYPPMSLGGTQNLKTIRATFQIDADTVNVPNGIASSSDWNWAVTFFYPPNTVEAFELPISPIVGVGVSFIKGASFHCRDREGVVFKATDTNGWKHKPRFGIRLMTLEQLEQNGENE